jgi:hypothetical protein
LFGVSSGNIYFPGLSHITSRGTQNTAQVRRFYLIPVDNRNATHTQMGQLTENHGTSSAQSDDNDVKVT